MDPYRERGTGYPTQRRSSHHGFTPMNNPTDPNQVSPHRITNYSRVPDFWQPGQSYDPTRITYQLNESALNFHNHRNASNHTVRPSGLPQYSNDFRSFFAEPPCLDRNAGYAGAVGYGGQTPQSIDTMGENRRREPEFQRDTYRPFAQQNVRYDERRYTLQNRIPLEDQNSGYENMTQIQPQGYNSTQDGSARPVMEPRVDPQTSELPDTEPPRNIFQSPRLPVNRSYRPNLTGQDIPPMPKKYDRNENEFNWAYQNYEPKPFRYDIDLDFKPKIFRVPSGLSCLALHKAKREQEARSCAAPSYASCSVRPGPSTVGRASSRTIDSRTESDRIYRRPESALHRTSNMNPISHTSQPNQNSSRRGTNSTTSQQETNQDFGRNDSNSLSISEGYKMLPFGRLTHSFSYGIEETLKLTPRELNQSVVNKSVQNNSEYLTLKKNEPGFGMSGGLNNGEVKIVKPIRVECNDHKMPSEKIEATPKQTDDSCESDDDECIDSYSQQLRLRLKGEMNSSPKRSPKGTAWFVPVDEDESVHDMKESVQNKSEELAGELEKSDDDSYESDNDECIESYSEQLRLRGAMNSSPKLSSRGSPWFIAVDEDESDHDMTESAQTNSEELPLKGSESGFDTKDGLFNMEEENENPNQDFEMDDESDESEYGECIESYSEELRLRGQINSSPKLSSRGSPWFIAVEESICDMIKVVEKQSEESEPSTLLELIPEESESEFLDADSSENMNFNNGNSAELNLDTNDMVMLESSQIPTKSSDTLDSTEMPTKISETLLQTNEPFEVSENLDSTEMQAKMSETLLQTNEPFEVSENLDSTEMQAKMSETLVQTNEAIKGSENLGSTEMPAKMSETLVQTDEPFKVSESLVHPPNMPINVSYTLVPNNTTISPSEAEDAANTPAEMSEPMVQIEKQLKPNQAVKPVKGGKTRAVKTVTRSDKPIKMPPKTEPAKVQKPRTIKKPVIPPAPRPTGYLGQRQRQRELILKNPNTEETTFKAPIQNANKDQPQNPTTSNGGPSGAVPRAPTGNADQKETKPGYGKSRPQAGPN